MKDICKYIVENWQIFVGAFLCLISFIFSLFKKHPKAYSFLDYVYNIVAWYVPSWIIEAEQKFMDGEDKKNYVLKKCLEYLCSQVFGLTVKQKEQAENIFSRCIEQVLSTPKKKI